MNIAFATDHGAFDYKKEVLEHLKKLGHVVEDFGTFTADSCDYPDLAYDVSKSISTGKNEFGILMCGTGIGMSLAANKVKGVRAAVVPNIDYARLSHEHNNANVICLSGRFMSLQECLDCIDAWLNANFVGDNPQTDSDVRHKRRVNRIMEIEKEYFK